MFFFLKKKDYLNSNSVLYIVIIIIIIITKYLFWIVNLHTHILIQLTISRSPPPPRLSQANLVLSVVSLNRYYKLYYNKDGRNYSIVVHNSNPPTTTIVVLAFTKKKKRFIIIYYLLLISFFFSVLRFRFMVLPLLQYWHKYTYFLSYLVLSCLV